MKLEPGGLLVWIVPYTFSTLNSGLRDETSTVRRRGSLTSTFSTLNSGLRDETVIEGAHVFDPITFSTLNSGLRDETERLLKEAVRLVRALSVPSTRAYAMKPLNSPTVRPCLCLSVPSTRAYAMKPRADLPVPGLPETFSTLNSGLRDETTTVHVT